MGLVHNHPHTWPRPFQPLEHRDFRLLWTATLLSNAGSWMQRVATAWIIYRLTDSTAYLGLEAFAAGIPTVLLLPLGGAIADRIDRRRLLLFTNLANTLLAAALAVAAFAHLLSVSLILITAFLAGILAAASVPASQSVLPSVAGEDHLPGAVSLNSLQYNLARALGPAAAGAALASIGAVWCFVLNALSFLALVAALLLIHDLPPLAHRKLPVLASIRQGLAFLRNRPDLRRILLLITAAAAAGAPAVMMLPALAHAALGQGAPGYALLLTAFGVGAGLAGLFLTFQSPERPPLRWATRFLVLLALAQAALPFSHTVPLSLLLTAAAGAAFVGAMIELGIGLLLHTPDDFRGRLSSVQQVLFRAAQPAAALLAGLLAAHSSHNALIFTFTLFSAALVLLLLILHFIPKQI